MGREIKVRARPSVRRIPGCGDGIELLLACGESWGSRGPQGELQGPSIAPGVPGRFWILQPSAHGAVPAPQGSLLPSTPIGTRLSTGKMPQNYSQSLLASPALLNGVYVMYVYLSMCVSAHRGTHRHACLFYPELSSPGQCTSLPPDIPNVDGADWCSSATTAVNY